MTCESPSTTGAPCGYCAGCRNDREDLQRRAAKLVTLIDEALAAGHPETITEARGRYARDVVTEAIGYCGEDDDHDTDEAAWDHLVELCKTDDGGTP